MEAPGPAAASDGGSAPELVTPTEVDTQLNNLLRMKNGSKKDYWNKFAVKKQLVDGRWAVRLQCLLCEDDFSASNPPRLATSKPAGSSADEEVVMRLLAEEPAV